MPDVSAHDLAAFAGDRMRPVLRRRHARQPTVGRVSESQLRACDGSPGHGTVVFTRLDVNLSSQFRIE